MGKKSLDERTQGLRGAVIVQFSSKYLNVALSLIVTMILARLLTPEQYGAMAVVSVFLGLFTVISNVGIGAAVVQYRELTTEDCGGLFTFTCVLGVVMAGVFCLFSFPISIAYSNGDYIPLMCFASLSVMFNSANMVPNGILLRDKRFFTSGLRLVVTSLVSSLVAIALALSGWGTYALVMNTVLQSFLDCVWNTAASGLPLGILRFREPLRKVLRFSVFQFLSQVLQYFIRNLDNMLIGLVMGATTLGFYDKAYRLAKYPVEIIPSTLNPVLKSFFSAAEGDKDRIYHLFFKVEKALSVSGVYIAAVFVSCAEEIVLLFFGSQWTQSVAPFAILSFSIPFQMTNYIVFSVLEGFKRTDYLLRHTLITGIGMAVLLGLGLTSGSLELTSAAVSLYFVLSTIPFLYFVVHKAFGTGVWRYVCKFAPEFVSGVVAGGIATALGQILPDGLITSLLAKAAVATLVYLLLIWRSGQLKYIKLLFKRNH